MRTNLKFYKSCRHFMYLYSNRVRNIGDVWFTRWSTRQFSKVEKIQVPHSHGMNISRWLLPFKSVYTISTCYLLGVFRGFQLSHKHKHFVVWKLQVINEVLRIAVVSPGLLRRALKDIEYKGMLSNAYIWLSSFIYIWLQIVYNWLSAY